MDLFYYQGFLPLSFNDISASATPFIQTSHNTAQSSTPTPLPIVQALNNSDNNTDVVQIPNDDEDPATPKSHFAKP